MNTPAGQEEPGPPDGGYPVFSATEMGRRRDALAGLLAERGIGQALIYGFDRSGSAIAWLTGWPVTREAALVFTPGERDLMYVCFNNHVPNARRLAPDEPQLADRFRPLAPTGSAPWHFVRGPAGAPRRNWAYGGPENPAAVSHPMTPSTGAASGSATMVRRLTITAARASTTGPGSLPPRTAAAAPSTSSAARPTGSAICAGSVGRAGERCIAASAHPARPAIDDLDAFLTPGSPILTGR